MKDLNIKRYQITSILSVLIFNIILQFIPLASVFGYEFSVLNSILFFILSGLLIIRKGADENILPLVKFISLVLLIPPVISVVYTLFTVKCSLTDGALFYIVNTVPAVLFGITTGLLALRFIPRFPRLFLFIVFLIAAILPLLEFYFNPQAYFYNLFLGYFPGTIYDEAIAVDFKLVVYRFFNIAYFGLLFFLLTRRKYPDYIISAAAILLFFIFIVLSPVAGFSSSKWKVEHELGGKCITPHFEIIYDKSISSAYLENLIMHHECYYNELAKFYHTEPGKKITSFVFKNSKQKSELFGAENADIAKPWLNQIYTVAGNYNVTLKHEISHIFSAKIGTGLFKVARSLNPALIEGIAVASDPFYYDQYVDHLAALAYKNNYRIDLEGLYSGFSFFGNVSSLSYIYSGSFCNFVIQKWGIEKFGKWYSGTAFESVYNYSLRDVIKDYQKYLSGIPLELNDNLAKLLFARQTIFSKVCPRYIGSRLNKASDNYNSGNYQKAEAIYREVLNITPNYQALSGLAGSLVKQKKESEALRISEMNSGNFIKSGSYFNLELLQGDLHALNGNREQAFLMYDSVLVQSPDLRFVMAADLKKRLLQDGVLKEYLNGNDSLKFYLLKNLNQNEIFFSSVPYLIGNAQSAGISKTELMSVLNKEWLVYDNLSSFSALEISDYLMEKRDFEWGRKFASMAYRDNQENFSFFLRSNYLKAEWIFLNYGEILKKVTFVF